MIFCLRLFLIKGLNQVFHAGHPVVVGFVSVGIKQVYLAGLSLRVGQFCLCAAALSDLT